MTKRQKIFLVALLLLALLPVVTGHKKHATSHGKGDNDHLLSGSSDLISEANAALIKLAELDAHTVPNSQAGSNIDRVLQGAQLSPEIPSTTTSTLPAESALDRAQNTIPEQPEAEVPVVKVTAAPEHTDFAKQAEPEPTTPSTVSLQEVRQVNADLLRLRSQLREVQNDFKKRETELVTRLGIEQEENVKLSHQLQAAESKSSEIKKGEQQQRSLVEQIQKLEERLDGQAKLATSRKSEKADLDRRIGEEQKLRRSVEQQLEDALKKQDAESHENTKLRTAVQDFEQRLKLLEEQRLAEGAEKDKVLMKQVSAIQHDLSAAKAGAEDGKKKSKSLAAEIEALNGKVAQAQRDLLEKQKQSDELAVKLATAERLNEQSKSMQHDLLQAQNDLLVAREQINTLRSTSRSPSGYQPPPNYPQYTPQPQIVAPAPVERIAPRPNPPTEYMTVEVTAPKVVLRAGPGEGHGQVMEIQQGSVLMVETREGNWYRVITPKGDRAYLRADLAQPVNSNNTRPRYSPPVRTTPNSNTRSERGAPNPNPLVDLVGTNPSNLDPDAQPAPPPPQPTAATNEEDEKSAFEMLQGLKVEGNHASPGVAMPPIPGGRK